MTQTTDNSPPNDARPGAVPRVPPTAAERDALRARARARVASHGLTSGMPLETLREHARLLLAEAGLDAGYADFMLVVLNNITWHDEFAAVPFERRLLVLPECQCGAADCPDSGSGNARATNARGCGMAVVRQAAERLGYRVIVAAHPYLARDAFELGQVDALLGISCLAVLESVFPLVHQAGIPAIAIPLLQDDCVGGPVDLEWVWEVLELTRDDAFRRVDMDAVRRNIDQWFSAAGLVRLMGPVDNATEAICREWLARDGKRWRPFLAVCTHQALRDDGLETFSEGLQQIAVAVECFHKASLVHDDIEDDDDLRYGEQTLHVQYGMPVALNVGDLILGHGYRLIGECGAPAERQVAMLRAAAEGHRQLCIGQGAELNWIRSPTPLHLDQVLEIFSKKTAPAFEVALQLGAIQAGADAATLNLLARFSTALGIAYQIRDDLDDFLEGAESNDTRAVRPSLMLALAYERSTGEAHALLDRLWRRETPFDTVAPQVYAIYRELRVDDTARSLLDDYRRDAGAVLQELRHPTLRGLLRRVLARILPHAVA